MWAGAAQKIREACLCWDLSLLAAVPVTGSMKMPKRRVSSGLRLPQNTTAGWSARTAGITLRKWIQIGAMKKAGTELIGESSEFLEYMEEASRDDQCMKRSSSSTRNSDQAEGKRENTIGVVVVLHNAELGMGHSSGLLKQPGVVAILY